ncbi:MAG: phage tail protein [Clostridia bacterium]|nr:phage tail protein [Clostridia bacterium]
MAEYVQPYRNFNFSVVINGFSENTTGFSEVSGFDATFDVVEYREGNMEITPMKIPGLIKYGNITLKRGASDNTELYDWLYACFNEGKMELHDMDIYLFKPDATVAAQWHVKNAWPVKYAAPDFNASGSEIAYETIELAHEGIQRMDQNNSDARADGSATFREGGENNTPGYKFHV